jgi:hypothetical protein
MTVLDSLVSQQCPRPAGAHEYRYHSLKSGEPVRLYDRITLWRWLTLEFDPSVTELKINAQIFESTPFRIPIVFSYSKQGRPHLITQDSATEAAMHSLQEYCSLLGISLETIEEKWTSAGHVEMWNLLKMMSYINKWHYKISEKRLGLVFRDITIHKSVSIKEMCEEDRMNPETLALSFELVRRGRLRLLEIASKKISQNTQISI